VYGAGGAGGAGGAEYQEGRSSVRLDVKQTTIVGEVGCEADHTSKARKAGTLPADT
jgi:hypothetical protein